MEDCIVRVHGRGRQGGIAFRSKWSSGYGIITLIRAEAGPRASPCGCGYGDDMAMDALGTRLA